MSEATSIATIFEDFGLDHAPDGWPPVKQMHLTAAAAELRRLEAQLQKETAARQAAQIEAEALKERLVRADAEKCAAVLAERIAPKAPMQEPEIDVRNIMLAVVPGFDGMGAEVYAKSTKDVEDKLSALGSELEEWQLGIRRLPAPVQEPDRIAQLEAANTNLFEQGQKMHKRIQELEKDCKIGAQEMVKAYEEIDNLKAQVSWQKPVAWCQLGLGGKSIAYFDGKPMIMTGHVGNQHHPTPLFTAQPQRFAGKAVKLSEDEIQAAWASDNEWMRSLRNVESAVWAKLGVTE